MAKLWSNAAQIAGVLRLKTEIKCYLTKLSNIYHSDNLFLEIAENILNIGCYAILFHLS